MNKREQKMLDILKKGREEFGYVGVKAEFEAEGTRTDELLRLMEIARKADLDVGLKIGGCEAVRDLIESKQFGVEFIIAPMIETSYALSKFIDAKNKVYSTEEQMNTEFLYNLETETAFQNRLSLFEKATANTGVNGVVFGRVDYAMSRNISRENINASSITASAETVAKMCTEHQQDLVVGGGISEESIPVLQMLRNIHLTRFETRKIIFSSDSLTLANDAVKTGLLQAVHFELLWLQNKREYYRVIETEDEKRIEMLEARWNVLGSAM